MSMNPEPITIDGRKGTVVYLDDQWKPVSSSKATSAKVVFDDGGRAFYTVEPDAIDLGSDKSGNYGHKGRPGEVGGSAPSDRTPAEQAERDFKSILIRGERREAQLDTMRVEMADAWKAWADDTQNRKKPLKPDGAAAKKLDSYKKAKALEEAFHVRYEANQVTTRAQSARAREILKVPKGDRAELTFTDEKSAPLNPMLASSANRALAVFREYDGSGAFIPFKFPADKVEEFRKVFGDDTPIVTNKDGTASIPTTLKLGKSDTTRAHATFNGVMIGTGRSIDAQVYHEVAHHIEMRSESIKQAAIALRDKLANTPREEYTLYEASKTLNQDEKALRGNFPDPYSAKLYPNDMATEMISTGVESYMANPLMFARERPEHFKLIYDVLHGKYRSDGELKPSDFKEKTK